MRRLIGMGKVDLPSAGSEDAGSEDTGLDEVGAEERSAEAASAVASRKDAQQSTRNRRISMRSRPPRAETGASRAPLLVLIGKLVLGSANNESLLIYILMVLLQTDEPSAAIVFSTLNTTESTAGSRLPPRPGQDRRSRDPRGTRRGHQTFQRRQPHSQRIPARDVHGEWQGRDHAYPDHASSS